MLVTQLERAGAQNVALIQARYFYQKGYKIILCFLYDKQGILEEWRCREPFPVINLEAKLPGKSRFSNGLRTVRALWRLYRLLVRERIQIIETLTHYSNVLGVGVAWLARVPVRIVTQHSAMYKFPRWFICLNAYLTNSQMVDRLVAVSESTLNECIDHHGINQDKTTVIYNGIDLDAFDPAQWSTEELELLKSSLGVNTNAIIVITVARLHPLKGHSYLVAAASRILESFPETVFLLVGDGDYKKWIKEEIISCGLNKVFHFLGNRADIPQLLALSDLFVLPSISEGMPLAVLEAMAAKVPVVATSVGGIENILVNGESGILVEPGKPESLSEAVTILLKDKRLCQSIIDKAYFQVINKFSPLKMCRKYETLMLSIISKKIRLAT